MQITNRALQAPTQMSDGPGSYLYTQTLDQSYVFELMGAQVL